MPLSDFFFTKLGVGREFHVCPLVPNFIIVALEQKCGLKPAKIVKIWTF